MNMSPADAKAYVMYQIGALDAFCKSNGVKMQHVKPHGALYNMAGKDYKLARAICEGIQEVNPELILLGLSGSQMLIAAEEIGLPAAKEVFADRAYGRWFVSCEDKRRLYDNRRGAGGKSRDSYDKRRESYQYYWKRYPDSGRFCMCTWRWREGTCFCAEDSCSPGKRRNRDCISRKSRIKKTQDRKICWALYCRKRAIFDIAS